MKPSDSIIWQAKLAAWLHDPAEKALILMRANHEEDSSIARLRELLFPQGIAERLENVSRLADHWASAADRPTMPKPGDPEYRAALDVRFWGRDGAFLVHPLAGDQYRISDAYVDTAGSLEKASFAGLYKLVEDAEGDTHSAFLSLWRLGPQSPPPGTGLGHLWKHLPADTRIPDHSIWEHLSLTSAFAGAMAADPEGNPALLAVNLGPVQSFIAQARSTSDLWAGSHLLASLSWEAMKVVCERYGPDAVIFPSLWGVPLVDVWLEEQCVEFPKDEDWKRSASDANPLFQAALPNRFVALVPAAEARATAEAVAETVRYWMVNTASEAAERLLKVANFEPDSECDLWKQIDRQLEGFPEVHWAAVPFAPLVEWSEESARKGTKTTVTNINGLREALALFHPKDGEPGFLASPQWKLLQEAIEGDGIVYVPNPGVLYPALYDLLDRLVAASKTARPFVQTTEEGYRCSLCGEREWLRGPGDHGKGTEARGKRGETLWTKVAAECQPWAREGEHLCALCATKRLWPTLFSEWAAEAVPELGREKVGRYVVSTHTMALAADLEHIVREGRPSESSKDGRRRAEAFDAVARHAKEAGAGVALPKRLADLAGKQRGSEHAETRVIVRRLPRRLDELQDDQDAYRELTRRLAVLLGHKPEAYYALLLFDGDRMGAWISGTDPELTLPFKDAWHPAVVGELTKKARGDDRLGQYLQTPRPPSPARHAAISSALNGFSLYVARWVVEELFAGKLIYSGGDDVLAMLPVDDVLACLLVLRCAYSGVVPAGDREAIWELYGEVKNRLTWIDRGHVLLGGKNGRLLRMMGGLATGSAGVVIAHHQTPLAAVLRELRAAERRAKNEGGRNAFSISLMKRAGGMTHFTAGFGFGGPKWEPAGKQATTLGTLFALRDTLATEAVSRRAAYNILAWLPDLPERPGEPPGLDESSYRDMLGRTIAWQLRRQGVAAASAEELGGALVSVTSQEAASRGAGFSHTAFLAGLFTVAEFLAREGRTIPGKGNATAESDKAVEGGVA